MRDDAADFRDAPAFHDQMGTPIRAHQEFLDRPERGAALGFNDLELVAKFLREARRTIDAGQ